MENKKENKFTFVGCLAFVSWLAFAGAPGVVIGLLLYKIWKFFLSPNLLNRLLDVVGGIGICAGIVILVLFILTKIPDSWFGKYTDDWH